MHKLTSLLIVGLFLAISVSAQPSKQHFSIGMSIDEFASNFDVGRSDTPDAATVNAAALSALRGERATIRTIKGATTIAFLFEDYTLVEAEITNGSSFDHELQALSQIFGDPGSANDSSAMWDRKDGTRFTLTSREGTGVLVVTATPSAKR